MKIALIGDIAFFGRFSKEKNRQVEDYFNKVAQYLSQFDYVIGNLETPFIKYGRTSGAKSAYIGSPVENGKLLKLLHVDAVSLANNHIFDFGAKDFEVTKSVLEELEIQYFGDKNAPLEVTVSGEAISLQGFCCYSSNPLGVKKGDRDYGINPLSFPGIEQFIKEAAAKGQLPIAAVHCGQEHVNYPNYDHVRLARQLAEVGDYVFYGHHPHVLQGIERKDNSVLAYSLGNFCFDDVYTPKSPEPLIKQSENNKQSAILELTIKDGQVTHIHAEPIYIGEESLELKSSNTEIISELQKQYNDGLKLPQEAYVKQRSQLLETYIAKRKKRRNFTWYLRRMNYTSFAILRNAYVNRKKYKNLVLDHLIEE